MAWNRESRPWVAEPPAESPSTIYSSVSSGLTSLQSRSLSGMAAPPRAVLRRTDSRAFLAASRAGLP